MRTCPCPCAGRASRPRCIASGLVRESTGLPDSYALRLLLSSPTIGPSRRVRSAFEPRV